jgi:hypothetical protein
VDPACSASVGPGPPFLSPRFVARAPGGDWWVADRSVPGVYAIVRVDPADGSRTIVSGCTSEACGTVVGAGPPIGRLFGIVREPGDTIAVADGQAVYRVDPATGDRTIVSGCTDVGCGSVVGSGPSFGEPVDLLVEPAGTLLVSYRIENVPFGAIRRVDPVSGARTLVSGCQNEACTSQRGTGPVFVGAFGLDFDADGDLVASDADARSVLRVDPVSGNRTVLSGCVGAGCPSAVGEGTAFAEPLDVVVIPEPDGTLGGAAALALLGLRCRRG